MSLPLDQLIWSLVIAFSLGGALAYLFWKQRKEVKQALADQEKNKDKKIKENPTPMATQPLQLQAYERLILLVDRIALPNIISRNNVQGTDVKEMQSLLTTQIRQEYEYNVTQQIYVTAEAWEAIRNLKDQNILIINQIASFLPAEASGADLGRSILEMLVQQPKASLHNVVADVLSYEAKKLM